MTRLFLLASAVVLLAGTTARAGSILVSSQHTDQIRRYDLATGQFEDVFASGGGLSQPIGLTYGPDGSLYVASYGTSEVLRYGGTTGRLPVRLRGAGRRRVEDAKRPGLRAGR
jgi:hypothetical protein